jgi:Ion channel
MNARTLRRRFLAGLFSGLSVVWPILSGLLAVIVGLGIAVGLIEGWSLQDSIYFSFVSGLTIGYGDLVPRRVLTRALAILIGMSGVVATAVVAAIAVRALSAVSGDDTE